MDQVGRCEATAPRCGRGAGHRARGLATGDRSAWTQPRKLPMDLNRRAPAGSDCNAHGASRCLRHSAQKKFDCPMTLTLVAQAHD
jgi:hypothetical protein